MNLADFYRGGRFGLSFELFPPKTDKGLKALFPHVEALTTHRPDFITCTYGAGGSTRDRTLQIVTAVKERFGVPVASHLTCVGSDVDELRGYLQQAAASNVDAIVALRGDPPRGDEQFRPVPGGLRYANELVALIRTEFPRFGIAVAGYPETHQEAPSPEIDLKNLKRKVEAGADVVVTQLFYDNEDYFSFVDRCRRVGIEVPIVPGLLPITNLAQVERIASLCKAKLPQPLVSQLSARDDPQWQYQVGVAHAIDQVQDLVERGAPGVHFYVLNKSQATGQVLRSVELPDR